MKAQSLKGLFLVALVVSMAPLKAKAEASDKMQAWKSQSRIRIEAALMLSSQEIEAAKHTEPENVYDFSDSGIQIVVVNASR